MMPSIPGVPIVAPAIVAHYRDREGHVFDFVVVRILGPLMECTMPNGAIMTICVDEVAPRFFVWANTVPLVERRS